MDASVLVVWVGGEVSWVEFSLDKGENAFNSSHLEELLNQSANEREDFHVIRSETTAKNSSIFDASQGPCKGYLKDSPVAKCEYTLIGHILFSRTGQIMYLLLTLWIDKSANSGGVRSDKIPRVSQISYDTGRDDTGGRMSSEDALYVEDT